MLSKKEFQILARKTGFLSHYLEKVYRLFAVLEEISKNKELSEQIALKGGTAINHFFFRYPRLSIDLDFDYLIPVPKEELESRINAVEAILKRIFRFLQYEISDNKLIGHSQYYLRYATQFGGHDVIKVEVNFLLRQHLADPVLRSPHLPFDLSFKAKTLSMEEIYAAKCTALLDRGAPRDLFDVYHFNVHNDHPFDAKLFRRFFLFYASLSRRNMKKFKTDTVIVESITEKDIKNNLWMLLSKENRVKRNVMLKTVLPFIKDLLALSADEKKFFELFNGGKVDFGLLFADKILVEKLANHPMVLWRQLNQK